MKFYQLY